MATMVLFAVPGAFAANGTWVGKISDSGCGASHAKMKAQHPGTDAECTVACVKSGGKSEIRNGPRGQYGVCILPDGRTVEEWAYYRKNKGKAGSGR